MTITVGGSGGLPQLAPDAAYPSTRDNGTFSQTISGIDGSSGIVTAVSLTGAYAISRAIFNGLTLESNRFRLTIDGVEIFDDTYVTPGTQQAIVGGSNSANDLIVIQCKTSFLLEIATTTDTSVDLVLTARPIL